MSFKLVMRWRNVSSNSRNPYYPSSTGSSCFKLHWKLQRWYQVKRLLDVLFDINALNCDLRCLPRLPISSLRVPNVNTCQRSFLLADVVLEGNRMLLFVSDFFLSLLCEGLLVFADGTFQTMPCIFTQLFTVNFKYHSKLLPVVYALVRRKTQSVYERILQEIQTAAANRGFQFQPTVWLNYVTHVLFWVVKFMSNEISADPIWILMWFYATHSPFSQG